MEAPVTPKLMPASSPNLPTNHTGKLFGIVYIILTGVIEIIILAASLWSWVVTPENNGLATHNWVPDIQAPPILLVHEISDSSDIEESDAEDPNAYGYSVFAVPETLPVPYKLCSGKTTTTSKPFAEAKKLSQDPTSISQCCNLTNESSVFELGKTTVQ
ncbi:hypothetical protein DSO57_1008817 [Entomophthora muscae]|uniref:Uncharacterized protein n=1 Tax=Entomophthora muscae TaxID=34485 RepID=A0ACC2RLS0_9FUNG|nr:hypothetical protein DSO57_1008817 [Entomophthora muscae]